MEQLIELLKQIQELAGVGIDALSQGAEAGGGEAPPAPEGEAPTAPEQAPPGA